MLLSKKYIKYLIAVVAAGSGLSIRLIRKRSHWPLVVAYHRVIEPGDSTESISPENFIVRPADFECQLKFIKSIFRCIDSRQMSFNPSNGSCASPMTCLITFDDGWHDTADVAFPILKRHSVPATVFVATSFIGNKELYWPHKLWVILKNKEALKKLVSNHFQVLSPILLNFRNNEQRLHRIFFAICSLSQEQRKRIINDIHILFKQLNDETYKQKWYMDWEQVSQLYSNGIVVASHTHLHEPLTLLTRSKASEELISSRKILERVLQTDVRQLSFPHSMYNSGSLELAYEAGYRLVFGGVKKPDAKLKNIPAFYSRLTIEPRLSSTPGGKFSKAVFTASLAGILYK